jgi:hypothetical protein
VGAAFERSSSVGEKRREGLLESMRMATPEIDEKVRHLASLSHLSKIGLR